MLKQRHLAKSIGDAGWGAFLILLTDTAACAGRRASGVQPAPTSHRGSGCGAVVTTGLSVRWQTCPVGGRSLRRDHNAAKNRVGPGRPVGETWRWLRRRTENPFAECQRLSE